MPPKASQRKHLKAARQMLSEKKATLAENSDEDVNSLRNRLYEASQQTQLLEQQLADQEEVCANLQNSLNASQDLINTLCTEILSLKSKNSDIYHQLRMERQCYKRATSKHGSMTSQILLLKKADAMSSAQLSKGLRDSAATITNLLKMNEDLRTELSHSVTA